MYFVWIYLGIFILFTGTHLYASYLKKDSLRAPTKLVILPAVLGMYLEWSHALGTAPSTYVVFALVTSWLGDVLLIPKGIAWFTAGGLSFGLSHILFIMAYIESGIEFSALNPFAVGAVTAIYVFVVTLLFRKLKRSLPHRLYYPTFLYLLANGTMNVFVWLRILSGSCPGWSGIITVIGALLFFISDCTLFFVHFDRNCPLKTHFPVMLTYSLGEFLIALGFMLFML